MTPPPASPSSPSAHAGPVAVPLDDLRLRWTLICSKVHRQDLLGCLDVALAEVGKRDRRHPPNPSTLAGIVEYSTEKLEDQSLTLALLRAVHTYSLASADTELADAIPPGYMQAIVRDRPTTPTPERYRRSESELIAAGEGKKAGGGGSRKLLLLLVLLVVIAAAAAAAYLLVLRKH